MSTEQSIEVLEQANEVVDVVEVIPVDDEPVFSENTEACLRKFEAAMARLAYAISMLEFVDE